MKTARYRKILEDKGIKSIDPVDSIENEGETETKVDIATEIAIKKSIPWIITSYATYTITLIGVAFNPLYGLAMIPKTIAYLIVLYYMNKYILRR